jgi:hypothetical protein
MLFGLNPEFRDDRFKFSHDDFVGNYIIRI